MFEVGQRVRVKAQGLEISGEYGGRTGKVEDAEDQVSEELPVGTMAYEVRLDPVRANDVERRWFNDYELEAIDG